MQTFIRSVAFVSIANISHVTLDHVFRIKQHVVEIVLEADLGLFYAMSNSVVAIYFTKLQRLK